MSVAPVQPRACDYCGLAVPEPIWKPQPAKTADGPAYCCYGCRLAHSIAQETGEEGATRLTLTRLGIALFFAMNVMVFTLALWAYDTGEVDRSDRMAASFAELLRSACLVLSLPVLILLGRPLLENALAQLRRGILSTDLLLLSGVLAAYAYSIVQVWTGNGPLYFEVGCMILVMVTLGRWLEATGRLKSTQALDRLLQLLPDVVTKVNPDGTLGEVDRAGVQPGETLRVRAGARIPTDGIVQSAAASIDEQLVTGESWPVEKVLGDPVYGGTLNLEGDLVLRVNAASDQGTLARLVAAVRDSRDRKGAYQQLTDRIAGYFFPFVTVIAGAVFAAHGLTSGPMTGLMAGLSVLLIACPCALGLATPMAVWAGMGTAARRGVVFRSPEALERLATVKALRFDKTGTLTTGRPMLSKLVCDSTANREEVRARAAALAETSSHVFSQAIRATVDAGTAAPIRVQETLAIPGQGVRGRIGKESEWTALGNVRLLESLDLKFSAKLQQARQDAYESGRPVVLVGWSGAVRGLFVFEEDLRDNVQCVVEECQRRRMDVAVLTGDHARSAERLREQLKITVTSELSPREKEQAILSARQQFGPVALVGDGINDAPALAACDVGIALGCGADVTRESADVCLIADDLSQIPWLLDLSRKTVATIKVNLAWAFGYNGFGILLAATGWLHPAFAAIMMVGSSVFVISNSLRLSSDVEWPESAGSVFPTEMSDESARRTETVRTRDQVPT